MSTAFSVSRLARPPAVAELEKAAFEPGRATVYLRGHFAVQSLEAALLVFKRVRLMALAESLGGVETLISHPASMTHASVPADRRAQIGLTDGLVRISAGIEDPADLIDDIRQALA